MRTSRTFKVSRTGGFTLLELVIVLTILVALAGLVVPRLDFMRRSADTAGGAAGIEGLTTNLQTYRTVKGTYPDQFDSLLEPATSGTPSLYQKTFGFGDTHTGLFSQLEVVNYTGAPIVNGLNAYLFSLLHTGMTTVMDQTTTVSFPSDSGTTARAFSFSPTGANYLCHVKTGSAMERTIYPSSATIVPPATTPQGIPANVQLIALGVGPRCTASGVTYVTAPLSGGLDPALYYGRFVAVFACFDDGRRAELKAVFDPIGQGLNDQLRNYYQAQPE